MEQATQYSSWLNPPKQAIATYLFLFVVMVFFKLVSWFNADLFTDRMPWIIAGAFLLLFGLFNSIGSVAAPVYNKYWSRSIFSYMGLALLSGISAYLFSGLSINEAGSFRWIYMVLTFSYLIFLSIVGFIKAIVEIAQKKDTRNFDNRRYRRR